MVPPPPPPPTRPGPATPGPLGAASSERWVPGRPLVLLPILPPQPSAPRPRPQTSRLQPLSPLVFRLQDTAPPSGTTACIVSLFLGCWAEGTLPLRSLS